MRWLLLGGLMGAVAEAEIEESDAEKQKSKRPGALYLVFGPGKKPDFSALEPELNEKGYTLSETGPAFVPSFGWGGYQLRGGAFLVGGEGSGGGGSMRTDEGLAVNFGAGMGGILMGYMLRFSERFRVYPLFGIGGGGAGGAIGEADPEDFRKTVDDPEKTMTWGEGDLVVRVGLGAELTLGKTFGLILGVRVGYAFNPIQNVRRPFIYFTLGAGRLGG